jgi:hypothetical protein
MKFDARCERQHKDHYNKHRSIFIYYLSKFGMNTLLVSLFCRKKRKFLLIPLLIV